MCTICKGTNFLQVDASFCYPFCPTGYTGATNACSLSSEFAMHATFTEVDIGLRNLAGTNPIFETTAATTPVKYRGHHFDGTQHWRVKIDTPEEIFYLHHSFTIAAWVKIPTISADNAIFSKNKANPTATGEEDLLLFSVDANAALKLTLQDGTTALLAASTPNAQVTADTWAQLAAIVEYTQTLDTSGAIAIETGSLSTIKLLINSDYEMTVTGNYDEFFIDQFESRTSIGQEYDYTTTEVESKHLTGYIYDLIVYNVAKTVTWVQSRSQLCTCDSVPNTPCPDVDMDSTGTCISNCPIDTYGDSCDACHPTCGGNCVRDGDGVNCRLCDNRLCTKCETFDNPGTCFECVTFGITESLDCVCDATHVKKEPDWTCTCAPECTGCTTLDKYHCSTCEVGGFK